MSTLLNEFVINLLKLYDSYIALKKLSEFANYLKVQIQSNLEQGTR